MGRAERSGLGWIGKNANVITRDAGSWLLLGEILACAELEPDAGPHADFCGTCTACIDACPTSAIVAPGTIDSNLSISYWTIEHRGSIPDEMRAALGDWIFGCDVCQEVCPWNRTFGERLAPDALDPREDLAALDPAELLGLGEREFRARFSGTALMRARWQGMRRNACIVLGNRRRASDLPALAAALDDDDAELRAIAAWAIVRIGGAAARAILDRALEREPDAAVRAALGRASPDDARPASEPAVGPGG
jgi:epoxyqueuosine reductase